MKKLYKNITIISLIFLFLVLILYMNNSIGVFKSKIESESRKSHKVSEEWESSKSISSNIGAVLFYGGDLEDFSYSIYLNRKGLSFGYFYTEGGSIPSIDEGVAEITYNGYGKVLISINKEKIKSIEIDDGNKKEIIEIDSGKPFTLTLPDNPGIITMYNINDNKITTCKYTVPFQEEYD